MISSGERKILLFGIPCLIFVVILLIDYYIVGSVIGGSVFLVGIIGTWRRHRFPIRMLKVLFVLLVFFIFTNPAPQFWLPQFERRWLDNRTQLIEPDHQIMPEINNSFQIWFLNEYGHPFVNESDFETQVRGVDLYIRLERFQYDYDQDTYNGYYDYLPTIDEILLTEDENGLWHDDCDGISLMTASFLLYLGFRYTYISEVAYHFHTMVFQEGDDPKTVDGYYKGISLYRGMAMDKSDKISYYLFNQTEVFIPPARHLLKSIGEIMVDGSFWKFEFTWLYNGELTGLPTYINYGMMFGISILLGVALVAYVHAGITNRLKCALPPRKGRQIAFIAGVLLFLAFTCNYFIGAFSFAGPHDYSFLCNPILMITFCALLIWLDRKIK